MKTMNLVQSISRAGGGLFYSVRRLTQSLAELPGMEVAVHSLGDEFSRADLPQWGALPICVHPVVGPAKFGYAPRMLEGLLAEDVQLVHCHGIWMYPSIAASGWSRRTRRPYIISPHGMLDSWAVRRSAWKKRLADLAYEGRFQRGAACIRALCAAEAEAIRAHGLRNPIVVIPNGVDLPPEGPFEAPAWRSSLPPGSLAMLYLGRLHPKKNLESLLRGWDALRRRGAPGFDAWRLVIAGWEQEGYETRLKKLAAELSLGERVLFIGPQYDEAKHRTLAHADAMVLPSLSEGVPITILEAWAHRLPTAMTDECNLPEGFAAGAALRIGTRGEEIASDLADFVALDADRRRAMGSAGRRLAESDFSWSTVAQRMARCYEWMLGAGPPPETLYEAAR